jgi:hypothetical protein
VINPKFLKSKSFSVLETSIPISPSALTPNADPTNQPLNNYDYDDDYDDEYDDEDDENDDSSSQAELFSFNNNNNDAADRTNKKGVYSQTKCSVMNGSQRFKNLTPKSVGNFLICFLVASNI